MPDTTLTLDKLRTFRTGVPGFDEYLYELERIIADLNAEVSAIDVDGSGGNAKQAALEAIHKSDNFSLEVAGSLKVPCGVSIVCTAPSTITLDDAPFDGGVIVIHHGGSVGDAVTAAYKSQLYTITNPGDSMSMRYHAKTDSWVLS